MNAPWERASESIDLSPTDRESYEVWELVPIIGGTRRTGKQTICYVEPDSPHADVIEAAPDMLAALEALDSVLHFELPWARRSEVRIAAMNAAMKRAREAISKAQRKE